MKRIAILLATVALGSGCIVEAAPNTGGAAIYWSFFSSDKLGVIGSTSAGSTELCAAAAVDEIRITLTDPAGDVHATDSTGCITGNDVPGAAYDLETGWWDYYIAAYRGGVKVFDDAASFQVVGGSTTLVDTIPSALYWDATINYTSVGCLAGESIEFELYDSNSNALVYSTWRGTVNPPVAIPCASTSESMVIPSIPPGDYDFSDWIHYDAFGAPYRYNVCREWWTQPGSASVTVPTVSVTSATAPSAGPAGMCP